MSALASMTGTAGQLWFHLGAAMNTGLTEAQMKDFISVLESRVGNTGLDVSPICLGCMSFGTAEGWVHNPWALDEEGSRSIIQKALDLGINFFDTANAYAYGKSEEILGRALKDYANRDEVVIATKVFVPMRKGPNGGGLSRKHIMSEIDHSR